jgi:hypothetical protein
MITPIAMEMNSTASIKVTDRNLIFKPMATTPQETIGDARWANK